ncbi:MAG: glycosyltransferase family 4 protein [Sedimenticola sp.]|nr:glycosyltransferase family 4 protein [Sedimenticola sp.]
MSKNEKNNGLVYMYIPWTFDRLGGVDIIVDSIYSSFVKDGINVRIAEQTWENYKTKNDDAGRQFVGVNFPTYINNCNVFAKVRNLLSYIKYFTISLYSLHANNVKVINAHFPTKALFSVSLFKYLKLWNGRLILSFHGSDINDLCAHDRVWKFILNNSDNITTCSYALKDKFKNNLKCSNYAITVIQNGVDINYLRKCSDNKKLAVNNKKDYIVCLANFVPHKGQDTIIKAFAQVLNIFPDIKLVLAGGKDNGTWLEILQNMSDDLGISDSVSFQLNVPHEHVPNLLKNARLLVLTSIFESFGLVIAEAGALRTPVVASNIGGIPEIISSDEYGLLVPVGDVSKTADAICSLLLDEDKCERLSANLFARIRNKFTVEGMVARYKNIIIN